MTFVCYRQLTAAPQTLNQ